MKLYAKQKSQHSESHSGCLPAADSAPEQPWSVAFDANGEVEVEDALAVRLVPMYPHLFQQYASATLTTPEGDVALEATVKLEPKRFALEFKEGATDADMERFRHAWARFAAGIQSSARPQLVELPSSPPSSEEQPNPSPGEPIIDSEDGDEGADMIPIENQDPSKPPLLAEDPPELPPVTTTGSREEPTTVTAPAPAAPKPKGKNGKKAKPKGRK